MQEFKTGLRPVPRRVLLRGAATAILASTAGSAVAQGSGSGAGTDWPVQAVRYINVFPPGATTDIMSRLFCAAMSAVSGQQWVVENRAGAAGNIGTAAIAQARPDGYTMGLGSVASLAIAPHIYPSLGFSPSRDFTYVSGIWQVPNVLVVNRDLPVHSLADLIALLRAHPARFRYGTAGAGTTPHLSMEWLKQLAGVDVEHVTYRGGAAAAMDLLAGRIQLMFENIPAAVASVREGRARALAVTSRARSPALPEVPPLADTFPGFEVTSWGSLIGPAGMPWPVVDRANTLARQALGGPELSRAFAENGATPWWTTPEDLAAFRMLQERHFAHLVRISGARLE